jgi:hypothetical protein
MINVSPEIVFRDDGGKDSKIKGSYMVDFTVSVRTSLVSALLSHPHVMLLKMVSQILPTVKHTTSLVFACGVSTRLPLLVGTFVGM